MPITHAFTNPKADGGDATIARPSDWNADHVGTTELDYVEITSPVAITATTEAGADTAITSSAIAYDGSTTVLIEWACSAAYSDNVAAIDLAVYLYDGATSIGLLSSGRSETTNRFYGSLSGSRRLTPSAATHTYSIRASLSAAGDGSIEAGAGGSGNLLPAFIRITKV